MLLNFNVLWFFRTCFDFDFHRFKRLFFQNNVIIFCPFAKHKI